MCRRIGPSGSGELPEELTEKRYHAWFVNLTEPRTKRPTLSAAFFSIVKPGHFERSRGICYFSTANHADYADFRLRIFLDDLLWQNKKSPRLVKRGD
ncbi:MAG: hypothetical protein DME20_12555 [Verrucomicrobia bacterium]|nr:MAG: hypothetical protein DME20_12555 [Verrucomicrobiota bacterium]